MKKLLKILGILAFGFFLLCVFNPFLIFLPGVWLGVISFPRNGEPFLEAHGRAVTSFVESKGFGFSRVRNAELWNERSVKIEGGEYVTNHVRLIGLTSEEGNRYFDESEAPEKERIKKSKWRHLSEWEVGAIERLKLGSPYVFQLLPDDETDIRVIAPMFAQDSCLECHDVEQGELIGALDYWMQIWPPRGRFKERKSHAESPRSYSNLSPK